MSATTGEARVTRLERLAGSDGGGEPPVSVYMSDNGRDPGPDGPDTVRYNPRDVPTDKAERDAYFQALRPVGQSVVFFMPAKGT